MEKNQLIIIVLVVGAFLLFSQMKQTGYQVVAGPQGAGRLPLHAEQFGDAGEERVIVSEPRGWNDNPNDYMPEYMRQVYTAPTHTTPYTTPYQTTLGESCVYDRDCEYRYYCAEDSTCHAEY